LNLTSKEEIVLNHIGTNFTIDYLARKIGTSNNDVYCIIIKLEKNGFIKNNKLTKKGFTYIDTFLQGMESGRQTNKSSSSTLI